LLGACACTIDGATASTAKMLREANAERVMA
jgi:hypothetical protein